MFSTLVVAWMLNITFFLLLAYVENVIVIMQTLGLTAASKDFSDYSLRACNVFVRDFFQPRQYSRHESWHQFLQANSTVLNPW